MLNFLFNGFLWLAFFGHKFSKTQPMDNSAGNRNKHFGELPRDSTSGLTSIKVIDLSHRDVQTMNSSGYDFLKA